MVDGEPKPKDLLVKRPLFIISDARKRHLEEVEFASGLACRGKEQIEKWRAERYVPIPFPFVTGVTGLYVRPGLDVLPNLRVPIRVNREKFTNQTREFLRGKLTSLRLQFSLKL
ncbi:MAG: hypothetical protein Q7R43_00850 [Candidatus Daviesbacteria bacterium]|nr:hypothetical protein [Candidatus Daviesbacteria bacterium]